MATGQSVLHSILETLHHTIAHGHHAPPFLRWEIEPHLLPSFLAEAGQLRSVQRLDDTALDDTVPAGVLRVTDRVVAVIRAFDCRILLVAPRSSPPTVIVSER